MSEHPIRRRFLAESWLQYPSAEPGTMSLSHWRAQQRPVPVWIGARLLEISPGRVVIGDAETAESFGALKTLSLICRSSLDTLGRVQDILRPGDQVAVQLTADAVVERIQLLAPATLEMRPLPFTPQQARVWAQFLSEIQRWFLAQGFVPVETPTLVVCPGLEPHLEPLQTSLRLGSQRLQRALPTSPELHLKKLLAAGWSEIFEIRKCFRNDELSERHQPEFTMLEWYRAYSPLAQLKVDLTALLQHLAQVGLVIGPIGPSEDYTVAQLLREVAQIEVRPQEWADAHEEIWVNEIEPWLAARPGPVFVTDFPSHQAALARIGKNGWAERMELYWRGHELANGFFELNDPEEQRRRFSQDLAERQRLGRTMVPVDEEFLRALASGMPPASGMALGVDRLLMSCQSISHITRTRPFPI